MSWKDVINYQRALNVIKVLQRVFFTQEEYTAMLRLYNEQPSHIQPNVEDVACQWMLKNPGVWSSWKPADLMAKTELFIGGIFPVTGTFYAAPGMVPGLYKNRSFHLKNLAIITTFT